MTTPTPTPHAQRAIDPSHLSVDDSERLLRTHQLGRLAVRAGEGVDLFPVNYLVHDDDIYFRTAPGSKLAELEQHPDVAFEIDGGRGRQVWSVVVRGTATRLDGESALGESLIGASDIAAFRPWLRGEKYEFVRISTESVTGRRFTAISRQWGIAPIVLGGLIVVVAVAVFAVVATLLHW